MQISVAQIMSPIGYNIIALGCLHGVDGFIKLTDLGYDSVAYCIERCAKKRFSMNDEDTVYRSSDLLIDKEGHLEKTPSPSKWKRFVKGWNGVFNTAHSVGVATLCVFIGTPLVVIAKDLGDPNKTIG